MSTLLPSRRPATPPRPASQPFRAAPVVPARATRTHLVPLDGVTDEQVIEYDGYWWVQDKAIPFESYRGNPLKRLGKDSYALYAGKEATHFIDGEFVGRNEKYTPCLAAQLNIGVWFPGWGGVRPGAPRAHG